MGKCYTCVRFLMFTFNLIFLLLGMAILGIGIWLRVDDGLVKNYNMTPDQVSALHTVAYGVIVIGSIIMITSFMGCCGAIIENQCMLVFFFILLLIVAVVFLAVGAWVASAHDYVLRAEDTLTKSLEDGIDEYFVEDSAGRAYLDLVQNNLKCCGASNGIIDYPLDKGVQVEACQKYSEPCVDKMMGTIKAVVTGILAVLFLTAIVAILGMVFSMVLCCAIRKRE